MKQRGFTLLELSIVLVIIGLLAAGVLVGRDLIASAAIRGTLSDIEELNSAINLFRHKYQSLPGDTNKAEMMAIGTPGGPGANGDGDGTVFSEMYTFLRDHAGEQKEMLNLFYHLSKTGLIKGEYRGFDGLTPGLSDELEGYVMKTRISDRAFLIAASLIPSPGSTAFQLGNSIVVTGEKPGLEYPGTQAAMTSQQAFMIDSKLDDGYPTSGSIRTLWPYSGIAVEPAWNGCVLVENGLARYDVAGIWESYHTQVINPTPRPNRITCPLALRGAW